MRVIIADIILNITGKSFLDSLTRAERALLSPFTINRQPSCSGRKDIFCIDMHLLKGKSAAAPRAEKDLLIGTLKEQFSHHSDKKLQLTLHDFIKKCGFCFEDATFRKRISQYLMSPRDFDLLISKDLIVFFDSPKASFTVYFKRRKMANKKVAPGLIPLRLVFRMILHHTQSGTMLHSSSMQAEGNRGYVFAGPSGSGKSTVISLLGSKQVFSDDTTVIRREKAGGGVRVYANPWWNADKAIGSLLAGGSAPLSGVFFIQRARTTSLVRLSRKQALATLLYGDWAFQQRNFIENRKGLIHFFRFSHLLIRTVPLYDLKIKKTALFKDEFNALIRSARLHG